MSTPKDTAEPSGISFGPESAETAGSPNHDSRGEEGEKAREAPPTEGIWFRCGDCGEFLTPGDDALYCECCGAVYDQPPVGDEGTPDQF